MEIEKPGVEGLKAFAAIVRLVSSRGRSLSALSPFEIGRIEPRFSRKTAQLGDGPPSGRLVGCLLLRALDVCQALNDHRVGPAVREDLPSQVVHIDRMMTYLLSGSYRS